MANRVVVIGAGLVGLATAKAITEELGLPVTVIEKEHSVAVHQSGRNSGVVHAGLYYKPGSLKAKLCRQGAEALQAYCDERDLPYRATGKLVVASSAEQLPGLKEIARKAAANDVPDIRWLEAGELSAIEPYVRGIAALYSPATAVVDYRAVARQMADDIRARDGEIRLGEPVTDVHQTSGEVVVRTSVAEHRADHLVVCAGLQTNRLAAMVGAPRTPAIVPFRGEYFELVPESEHLVRSMVYPVPDPRYPFLGVHFTRGVYGGVHVGPNAVPAWSLEGYRWRDVDVRELAATVRWPGSRALARQHWRMGIAEMTASVSKRLYYKRARSYIPDLRMDDLRRSPPGVRAQALRADGQLEDDFALDLLRSVTVVRNAPSPAATSSLAIGRHLSGLVAERLGR